MGEKDEREGEREKGWAPRVLTGQSLLVNLNMRAGI